MDNNFSWGLEIDYIAHYGVPHGHGPNGGSGRYPWGSGAKWGKTPLGRGIDRVKGFFKKKKPITSNVETSEAKREINTSGKSEITVDEFNSKHKDILENDFQKYKLDSDYRDRMNKAADLGLRALAKISYDDIDPNNDADKKWFLFEDQTVGLPQIADMALRGKSKEEIEAAINDAQKVNRDGRYTSKVGPLADSGNPTKFIDEIIRLRDSQKSAESHEADRKAALESGDRNEIAKYFNESSYPELQQALNKANLKDQLNKSINDSKPAEPKVKTPEENRADYVKQELWSGDLNRIMAVAADKSVSSQDLTNAITKANTMSAANAKLNPSKAQQTAEKLEKVRNALDTGVKFYESGAQAWNTGASLYNLFGNPSKPLTKLPTDVKSFDPVKYAADQEKKSKEAEEKAKKAREAYVNQELWSGDLKRILAIAGDAKISNKEMEGAIAKAKQIEKLKNPPSDSEKKESKSSTLQPEPQKELKEKTKSVIESVSKKKLTDYEDYPFPNDDNYSPKQTKKTDDLGDYYKNLTSQEIPKWMYKASLDDYSDDYNFFD